MAGPNVRVESADREAAEWHARLGSRAVSAEALEDFFKWRAEPANADAWRRVEIVWGVTARMAGDPAIAAALDDAMSRGRGRARRSEDWSRALLGLAVAGMAAGLLLGGWWWSETRSVFVTGVGEARVVRLADGSTVRLDTDSRIRVRLSDGERRIALEQGQALFTVARDASRPFVVAAGDARVTAIGTVFDVRRDAEAVRVTLVSGVVEVKREAGEGVSRLAAGQQSRVTPAGLATRSVDVATETSWIEGRVVFRDTPLRAAVAEVNRYLDDDVTLDPAVDGERPVNGVFKSGDRDAFVAAASGALDLRGVRQADGSILLSERKNN